MSRGGGKASAAIGQLEERIATEVRRGPNDARSVLAAAPFELVLAVLGEWLAAEQAAGRGQEADETLGAALAAWMADGLATLERVKEVTR